MISVPRRGLAYEFLTNLFHFALGVLTAYLLRASLLALSVPVIYIAYETLTSKFRGEYVEDLVEYMLGVVVGICVNA